jgi:HEAT repeat protein
VTRHFSRNLFVIMALTGASAPVGAFSRPRAAEYSSVAAEGGVESEIWRLLLPPAKSPTPTVAAISASIVRLGDGAIPAIMSILLGEITEPAELVDIHPRAIELRREILIAGLRGFPVGKVIDHLRSKCSRSDALDAQLVAVQVLGEIGGAKALEAVLAIAGSIEPIHWMRTYVQVPIEDSLTSILSREPRLVKVITDQSSRLDAGMCPMIVRAVGRVGLPAAAPWLASLIGRDLELDLAVVEELVRIAERTDCDLSSAEIGKVRSLLDSRDARVRRAAVTGLGALGDTESITRLVPFLGSQDPLVVRAVHWSLKRLTGQALESDRAAWTAYCDAEQQWYEENWSTWTERLHGEDLELVAEAAGVMAQHPIFRNRAALEFRLLLNGEDVPRARLAAGALGTLGSRSAVPWLIECLRHDDETMRSNAWQSLRTLTGRNLPSDPDSWTDLASS